ncbi:hypothetical protein TNCV_3028371 [Trichonephila clavipes]|nr:hypothetical protein TNCV_3028371 [Trichonephila clavipes]
MRLHSGSRVMLGSPAMRTDQKAKQGAKSSQPEVPLTLRQAKSIISTYIDKYTIVISKAKNFGKSWETGHCRSNPEAFKERRGCFLLSLNHRT